VCAIGAVRRLREGVELSMDALQEQIGQTIRRKHHAASRAGGGLSRWRTFRALSAPKIVELAVCASGARPAG